MSSELRFEAKESVMSIAPTTQVRHVLQIDGAMCGFLRSVAGGTGFASVSQDLMLHETSKQILGPPQWEDVELRLDLPPAGPVRDWIVASWTGKSVPGTVVVTTVDPELNVIRERKFRNALLTGTTISALDASSKEPGVLTLKVVPESVETAPAGGTLAVPRPAAAWLRSNFRLELPGLDCTRVVGVDSFTVTQQFADPPGGDGTPVPGPLSFPDLTVTVPERAAATWQAWFEAFVVEGRNAATDEKNGRLTLLAADLAKELASIGLFNVGIFRLTTDWSSDLTTARVSARLYCDRMDFKVA
jgi:hypothetical protein